MVGSQNTRKILYGVERAISVKWRYDMVVLGNHTFLMQRCGTESGWLFPVRTPTNPGNETMKYYDSMKTKEDVY